MAHNHNHNNPENPLKSQVLAQLENFLKDSGFMANMKVQGSVTDRFMHWWGTTTKVAKQYADKYAEVLRETNIKAGDFKNWFKEAVENQGGKASAATQNEWLWMAKFGVHIPRIRRQLGISPAIRNRQFYLKLIKAGCPPQQGQTLYPYGNVEELNWVALRRKYAELSAKKHRQNNAKTNEKIKTRQVCQALNNLVDWCHSRNLEVPTISSDLLTWARDKAESPAPNIRENQQNQAQAVSENQAQAASENQAQAGSENQAASQSPADPSDTENSKEEMSVETTTEMEQDSDSDYDPDSED